jgi:predicted O-methyltransferase YrrM
MFAIYYHNACFSAGPTPNCQSRSNPARLLLFDVGRRCAFREGNSGQRIHVGYGVMGALDCATLYGLTRWLRPAVVVESGGFIGMSSAFILKAFADANLAATKLYSIEWSEDCEQGALIPDELRSASGGFIPMHGKVEDFLKRDQLPPSIDMFLHDSSHSYRHMLWEFRQFWPRLRDGGLLVSNDVQMNAAFPEFIARTYAHDKRTGRRDAGRTSHYEWGRWGYIGFAIKKASR